MVSPGRERKRPKIKERGEKKENDKGKSKRKEIRRKHDPRRKLKMRRTYPLHERSDEFWEGEIRSKTLKVSEQKRDDKIKK